MCFIICLNYPWKTTYSSLTLMPKIPEREHIWAVSQTSQHFSQKWTLTLLFKSALIPGEGRKGESERGRKEGRKEGREEGRKEERKEGRKGGRKEGRDEGNVLRPFALSNISRLSLFLFYTNFISKKIILSIGLIFVNSDLLLYYNRRMKQRILTLWINFKKQPAFESTIHEILLH